MSGFKLKQTKEELQALIDDISVQKEELASLIEDAKQLKEDLIAMRGDNNTTPQIDSVNELEKFVSGYTDGQNLKDVVAGTVDEDSEELIMS